MVYVKEEKKIRVVRIMGDRQYSYIGIEEDDEFEDSKEDDEEYYY